MPRHLRAPAAVGVMATLCLLLVGVAARTLTAQLPPADSLEVTELVLVNADGDRRATLSLVDDRPVLSFLDEQGGLLLRLGLSEDGPALLRKGDSGTVHNFLSLDPEMWPRPPRTR